MALQGRKIRWPLSLAVKSRRAMPNAIYLTMESLMSTEILHPEIRRWWCESMASMWESQSAKISGLKVVSLPN